ncbi:hypothetical protein BKA70DRAFT_1315638 [Coprinopsis sp. MPI-PUGE-AT-0042]|nr:hypothetical protein BKA70DRAFT_1315638 [Coprinopsis sp. MPI-PUGE-AT-0042]
MAIHEADLERQNVDAEIALLQEQIRILRTKRNTLAPISDEDEDEDEDDCPTWLAVTHVCHAWRSAAINPSMGYQWTKTLLLRSKDAPLSVAILQDWGDELTTEHRLERVIISLKDDKLHGLLNEVTNRMPNLSHLSLHNLSSDGLLLPSPLLANHAPQLRILSLDNFTPPWKSPILEGLTSLCILNTYHYHNIPPPPLKIFLDALARMPSLKDLAIEEALPHLDPSSPHFPAQCSLVIRHIRIPNSSEIGLRIFDVDESKLRELLQSLAPSWPEGPLLKTGDQAGVTGCTKDLPFWPFRGHWRRFRSRSVQRNCSIQARDSKLSLDRTQFSQAFHLSDYPSSTPISHNTHDSPLGGARNGSLHCRDSNNTIANVQAESRAQYGLHLGDLQRWLRFRQASGTGIRRLNIAKCSRVTSA